MKRLVIEIPDTMQCGFLNYVYVDNNGEQWIGTQSIDTADINAGHVTVEPREEV